MTKVVEDYGLRTLSVFVPRPVEGEELLSVGGLNSILEQTMLGRAEFEELAVAAGGSVTKPWYDLRLISLVEREG